MRMFDLASYIVCIASYVYLSGRPARRSRGGAHGRPARPRGGWNEVIIRSCAGSNDLLDLCAFVNCMHDTSERV